ncbi:hypothetical protein [Atlantibacter hermannii]|uniref:hypothetical protein n=1 Tax=Atlantibacter hermannii TaxID=565 RepID=UPI002FDB627F
MGSNKSLEAANLWQIERAKFEERHPDQRLILNRIDDQLQNNIWAAVTMLSDFSFAIREVERKAKEQQQ